MDASASSNDDVSSSAPLLAASNPKRRAGRKKFTETRHPVYRGVRRRNRDRWVCEVREPNKKTRIWLGTFPTLVMAARAHDVAALALRGSRACLNFADSAWRLPVPGSLDAGEIRRAALEAAEMFRPGTASFDDGAGSSGSYGGDDDFDDVAIISSDGGSAIGGGGVFELDVEYFLGVNSRELMVEMAEGLMVAPPPYWEAEGV
uniref:AP2/ERF domain-containing protein n=1 Tax=Kalanchoe fedtschenkoi TaxID=63787 RepID=A0A7N0V4C5_KALFE